MSKLKMIVGYLCGQMLKTQGDITRMQEKLSILDARFDKFYKETGSDCTSNTTEGTQNQKTYKPQLTVKGLAVIAAIESGLLPRVEGGWDDTVFNKFWDKYEQLLTERYNRTDKSGDGD